MIDSEDVQKDFETESGAVDFLYTPDAVQQVGRCCWPVSLLPPGGFRGVGEGQATKDGGIWGKGGDLPAGNNNIWGQSTIS